MVKNKKVTILKDLECLNCGFPFIRDEKFCPECGQKNKGNTLTFKSFISEVFNGFISWDAKFWKTIVPLLIKPGKVSKDYIEGKRNRYTNPFRFYLTVSILFFLILGTINFYQVFNELNENNDSLNTVSLRDRMKKFTPEEIDSIQKVIKTNLNESLKEVDSTTKKQLEKFIPKIDSTVTKKANSSINIDFGNKITKMENFYTKNPFTPINTSLDSLQIEKTPLNRFLYSRVEVLRSWEQSNGKTYAKKLISYASVSLFILLPIFTLFIKFVYVRRRYTYVEHLVFVFHTQTVFFILLTLFLIIYTINHNNNVWNIFSLAFLLYLFLAMKRFYNQGYIKTFIKYIFVNFVFVVLASVGIVIISGVAFLIS